MSPQRRLYEFEFESKGLTEAEKEVMAKIERGGYGVRSYARMTDRAPGTVGNLLRRARDKLEEQ